MDSPVGDTGGQQEPTVRQDSGPQRPDVRRRGRAPDEPPRGRPQETSGCSGETRSSASSCRDGAEPDPAGAETHW
eukprot:82564-Heterocapsa_arctica.AAC.1